MEANEMINEIKRGLLRGIGILVILGGALFAFQVTGTIKTWTTGETLTAADLNTTVQTLKVAIENAGQAGSASFFIMQAQGATRNSDLLGQCFAALADECPMVMRRSGTVKNAILKIPGTNSNTATCTITLRKNSADTSIQFSIPAGSTADITDSDSVNFVAGDTLGWRVSCPGITGDVRTGISFEF